MVYWRFQMLPHQGVCSSGAVSGSLWELRTLRESADLDIEGILFVKARDVREVERRRRSQGVDVNVSRSQLSDEVTCSSI